jgi:hypothetical protein
MRKAYDLVANDLKGSKDPAVAYSAVAVQEQYSTALTQSEEPNKKIRYAMVGTTAIVGIGLAIILFIAWILALMIVVESHQRIAIGQQLMEACDYSYMERDTPRYKLFNYYNDKVKLVNVAAQMCGVAYAVSIIVSFAVVGWLSWKTTLDAWWRKIVYMVAAGLMASWLLQGVANQNVDQGSRLFTKLVESPETKKTKTIPVEPLKKHLWSALVSGLAFVAMWMLSSGGPSFDIFLLGRTSFVGLMAVIWGVAAAVLALTSFQGTTAYNDVLVAYQSLKSEFENVKLSPAQLAALKAIYRRNHVLAKGSQGEDTNLITTMFEFMMHDKGAEFPEVEAVSETVDEKKALTTLRDVMSKLRRHDASEVRMRRWFRWLVVVSLAVISTVLWPLFMQFRRFDNMQLGGAGFVWMFLIIFILFLSAIVIVWVLSVLVSVGLSPDA